MPQQQTSQSPYRNRQRASAEITSSDAAAAIEQAQKDVNQAMNEMQQNPGLLEALQQQQQQIANSLGEMSKAAPQSQQVGKAQKAADKAAQQLAKSDVPAAIGSMKEAQAAMIVEWRLPRPGSSSLKRAWYESGVKFRS